MSLHAEPAPIVFVVDGNQSEREELELLVCVAGWQAETFPSARAFLHRPRALRPSCLIVNVSLPDMNSLDLQEHLASERPDMSVVFVASQMDVATTLRAIKRGAVDFLIKPFGCEALSGALKQAITHSSAMLARELEMQTLREHFATLSPRERQVMTLIVSGLLNKQVGGELGISEITVKAHRGHVMQKMKARSFAELINMAAKLDVGTQRRRSPIAPLLSDAGKRLAREHRSQSIGDTSVQYPARLSDIF